MSRKTLLIAIAALSVCTMMACGSKDSSKDNENVGSSQVADAADEMTDDEEDAPKTKEGVIAMLKEAYDDVNIIYGPRDEDDLEPNIDLFGMYCSKSFRELIDQVREIEAKKDSGDDYFFTDWNALWHFWDEGTVTPKDFDVQVEGDTADATFELVHGKETVTQSVSLVYEDGQWRVNDWLQRGMDAVSKVEQMKEYIEENK